jgi:hypothetical protein
MNPVLRQRLSQLSPTWGLTSRIVTFRSGGSGSTSIGEGHEVSPDAGRKIETSVSRGARKATYSNGRGERSHTERGDLNVPFALACEVAGAERWLGRAG